MKNLVKFDEKIGQIWWKILVKFDEKFWSNLMKNFGQIWWKNLVKFDEKIWSNLMKIGRTFAQRRTLRKLPSLDLGSPSLLGIEIIV
jgi:hypothetical protein